MRILALTNLYPRPTRHTIAAYNRSQFLAIAQNHELRVVAPVLWTERLAEWRDSVLPHDLPERKTIPAVYPTYYYPPRVLSSFYGNCYLASVRSVFNRVRQAWNPHVVLACWSHPDGWAAVKLARAAQLPVLIKVVGSDIHVIAKDTRRRKRVVEALCGADCVAAVSKDLADQVIRLGVPSTRVQVVFEGVDSNRFRWGDHISARVQLGVRSDHPLVLFVGNIKFSKGAGVLVEACSRLAKRGVQFHCYLVGRGSDALAVKALIERECLANRVTLAGECPQERLATWYQASDLVVLPSYSEGIPNVLREAMMCGKPFVATRVGGIPEITRFPIGRLVEPGDPDALAEAIESALKDRPTFDPAEVKDLCPSWEESARMLTDHLERIRRPTAQVPVPATPRLLVLTNLFPRPTRPQEASYNRHQILALQKYMRVCVVAPVLWTERIHDIFRSLRLMFKNRQDFGIRAYYPTYFFTPKVLQHLYGSFYKISVQRAFRRAILEFRPDIVLGCWSHPDGWAAVRLSRQYRCPVVVKVHGSDMLVIIAEHRRRKRIAEALQSADAVVAVSQDLAKQAMELGVGPNRVHVISHGVDSRLFRPGNQSSARSKLRLRTAGPILLYVGNIKFSKGAGLLVEACSRLAKRGLQFHCYLVGRGSDAMAVRSVATRLGLLDRITLAGDWPQDWLPVWYQASDLVVLPSYSEGIPNVLREAMMCGKPFVATRVGGIPEITQFPIGRLVEPGDPDALADAIESALKEHPTFDPAAIRNFCRSWDESAKALADLLIATYSSKVA